MIKIGNRLKEERKKQGYTIDQVAKATKIRPQFIIAIEEGEYTRLPGSSYTPGFVKNYIEFLGLPVRDSMAMFRREFTEKEYQGIVPDSFVGKENIPFKTIRFTRAVSLVGMLVVAILLYLFYQYRSAFFSPALLVTTPVERSTVSSQAVIVSGTTDVNATVTVNNLPAFVDTNGHFTKEIPVFPGTSTVTIKSVNSFGRLTTLERHIIVTVGQ